MASSHSVIGPPITRGGWRRTILFELLHDRGAKQAGAVRTTNGREKGVLLTNHEHAALRQSGLLGSSSQRAAPVASVHSPSNHFNTTGGRLPRAGKR
jgi:hypothetical protein